MYKLFLTPGWFNGYDLIFEAIGLIICLLIANYSWKIYKFGKENRHAYFSLSFLLVAGSLFVKIFTYSIFYFVKFRETATAPLQMLVTQGTVYANLLYMVAFFLQMSLMLSGLLLLFFISQKERSRLKKLYEVSQMSLFVYLILLIAIIANFKYVIFYTTSMVILSLIVLNYYKIHLNNPKNISILKVMFSFISLLIANIFFSLMFFSPMLYFAGELFLLLGFLLILKTYYEVMKD